MYSHFMCEHGIDLSGAPCPICEATPEYNWKDKKKDLTEEEKKLVEEHRKKKVKNDT